MRQIPEGLTVSSIRTEDIHGLGNSSIIVLAVEDISDKPDVEANKLLIFDKIENSVLNQFYNLFGYGSNYKLTYSFSLAIDDHEPYHWGYLGYSMYSLQLLNIVELTGDMSKELVVMFRPEPSGTSATYKIGIFSYSFDTQSYYMLGTFPPSGKYDLDDYSICYNPAPMVFRDENATEYNLYEPNDRLNLEYGSGDDNDIFVWNDFGQIYLIRTQMIWGEDDSHVSPHRHIISAFEPRYDKTSDALEWIPYFSKETTEKIGYCNKIFIVNFLKENHQYNIIGYE